MLARKLIYVGNGSSLQGIPARDLTVKEVKEFGGEEYLVSTRLYKRSVENKQRSGGSENKRSTK